MIGKQLGQYEILEKLGQGGMGEVWKARDTALDREVAIKVLPEAFASDPERLARFEREAKLLASLNHSGIAAVHGLHEQDGKRFLAMELVPGEDLSQRLSRGPLGLDEALFIGVQVAEALEAAHAQGVIHRDLKPANIMITQDGRAKVLDFGLAKVVDSSGSSASLSPTVTRDGTAAGVIMGTAAYMSPEQTRARPLDRRTDVWSFGCVLFECLTGGILFRGETVSDSLGAILHKEPDWTLLPPKTPPTVRLLLRKCLAKDPDKRLHDIADARIELEQAIEDPSSSSMGLADAALAAGAGRRGMGGAPLTLTVAGAALAAGLAAGWLAWGTSTEAPLRKLDLGVELQRGAEPAEVAISPDGTHVAYIHDGKAWIQPLDSLSPRAVEGSTGALAPFWSPDSGEIGYFAGAKLWRAAVDGGSPVAICDVGGGLQGGRGASWGEDGRILFSRGDGGLLVVPALGGEPVESVPLLETEQDLHEPHLLPDGRGVLFVVHPDGAPPAVLTLLHEGERRVLVSTETGRIHSPVFDSSGHILFRRTGSVVTEGLWALPFSLDSLEPDGEPFLVAPDAGSGSVSRDGTLAFVHRPGLSGRDQFAWVDRSGRLLETTGGERTGSSEPSLSPDGRRLAFAARDDEDRNLDLWVRDLDRGIETRLTEGPGLEFGFLWLDSGAEILYSQFSQEGPSIAVYRVPADGSGLPHLVQEHATASGLTGDGSYVASLLPEGEPVNPDTDADIWLMPLDEGEEPRILVSGPEQQFGGVVSPDGRWMSYSSGYQARSQVYLTRFPEATGRWQVSASGGRDARWDPRGDRLYFLEGDKLLEVSVGSGPTPELGKPTLLFELPAMDRPRNFTVSADGERFLIVQTAGVAEDAAEERSGIKVVQNWIQEFRD